MESGYTIEGLERAIQAAEKNIKTFEDAINKEHETIGKCKWMIEQINRKNEERAKIENGNRC